MAAVFNSIQFNSIMATTFNAILVTPSTPTPTLPTSGFHGLVNRLVGCLQSGDLESTVPCLLLGGYDLF